MAILDTVKTRLSDLLADWKGRTLKVRSLSGFIDFARKAIKEAMAAVMPLMDGPQKKQLVLDFAGKLFDAYSPLILSRLPAWLRWLAFLFGGEDLRDEFLSAVTVLIEVIFAENFKPAA